MSGPGDDPARMQALSEFQALTGLPEEQSIAYLEAADWDFAQAAQARFLDADEQPAQDAGSSADAVPENYTGPRTLDGRPVPASQRGTPSTASSSKTKKQPKKKGVATLGSLASSAQAADDDDDDEDDDMHDEDQRRKARDLFAGGEKSGLAVQDPSQEGGGTKKIISDILAQAKANARRPSAQEDEDEAPAGPSAPRSFRGTGQTLGGDGVESRSIPDPNAAAGGGSSSAANAEPQTRALHLWRDGFSIDDGELRRFDNPQNAQDLALIRSGRAPLHLMNVNYDQPIDVKLHQHDENYRPLPKTYKPFGGSGRRLGSEVPGDGNAAPAAAAPPAPATAAPSSSGPSTNYDESQPSVNIRIQLPDGARLPARFNTTQTLEDVYSFVQRASPDTQARPWVLATTFPNKDHTDRSLVLGDMPEFKKGGTAVVKWT